jgi:integrase
MRQRGIFEKVPGSGIWWVRYTDAAGRLRREKAGARAAARDLYIKRKNDALIGRKLPEKLRRAPVLFREIAYDAIVYIKDRYARPADDVARLEVVKTWFGDHIAEAITPDEIEAKLKQAMEENSWAPSTANRHLMVLSLTFRLAIRNRKVKESPVRGIRRRTENNNRVRFLTPDEERRLRNALLAKPEWAEHLPEVDLALHMALRRTDMYRRLVSENVDLAQRIVTVPRSKNGESVHVPLDEDAIRALRVFRSRGDGTGRVVRNAAGAALNGDLHWFRDAVCAAGIKDFRWHDLRHTFASRLRQRGVPLGTIAELLGHKTLAMTQRYAHLSIANLHEAVARLSSDTTNDTDAIEGTRKETAYIQ